MIVIMNIATEDTLEEGAEAYTREQWEQL